MLKGKAALCLVGETEAAALRAKQSIGVRATTARGSTSYWAAAVHLAGGEEEDARHVACSGTTAQRGW